MHQSIAQHKESIAELCRRYHVAKLEVFGSAARDVDFLASSSDADFLVEFERPSPLSPLNEFIGFRDELAKLLGRPVDLVEPRAIRNPFVSTAINENRELVYAA